MDKLGDKRSVILETAMNLFSEHGFEGTSIRMLAAAAHVNVAMVSYYFGSKEKLLEALVEEKTRFMWEKLQVLSEADSTPWEKITGAIELYVDRILANQKFSKIIYREITFAQRSEMTDSIRESLMRNSMELKKIIEEGQKKGVFRKVDVELTIASIFGTISQVTLSGKLTEEWMGAGPEINSDQYKIRIKNHLNDLIRSHLKINNI